MNIHVYTIQYMILFKGQGPVTFIVRNDPYPIIPKDPNSYIYILLYYNNIYI